MALLRAFYFAGLFNGTTFSMDLNLRGEEAGGSRVDQIVWRVY
jgi:hypothetical protein